MTRKPVTVDISGQLVFLGTGTSTGVPVIGCGCQTCTSGDPRNRRTRCGLAIGLPEGNLLIDTPTDLRQQLLREGLGIAHAVAYSHAHADHLFGLDDVRIFCHYLGGELPLYCETEVEARIRHSFDYAFDKNSLGYGIGAVPRLAFRTIGLDSFWVLGARVAPIRLYHGRLPVLGFRFGDIAYCTDTNRVPDESRPLLEGLDVLILDCLRPQPHPTHFSLDEAIAEAQRIGAKRTLFTHISCRLEHEATNAVLPPGMELAHDGLRVPLKLKGEFDLPQSHRGAENAR